MDLLDIKPTEYTLRPVCELTIGLVTLWHSYFFLWSDLKDTSPDWSP